MAVQEYEIADDLLAFIDAAPSPWHAAAIMAAQLEAMGFEELREDKAWTLAPGRGYFVRRGGASLIAFRVGRDPAASGLRIIGAHTDSPGFRMRPEGSTAGEPSAALGVEIYGGPIIATFADRDLTLAGRVWCRGQHGEPVPLLYAGDRPLVRLPNLAIHLNRGVNEDGLKFQLQDQLGMVFSDRANNGLTPFLAEELGHDPGAVLGWELALTDTQPGTRFGADGEYIANGQIDNLASCHAGLCALVQEAPAEGVTLLACFDHEEVGSESHRGAAGTFLPATVERILAATDAAAGREAIFARSWVVSADMAHAWNPNFPQAYDQRHAPRVNGGPVIKLNAKQRYASDGEGEIYFRHACERAGVPVQRYVHRNDLPCGSTIGPITAARLGIRTVDVGGAMWAMHSARESAGALDPAYLVSAFRACLSEV
ncbi:putative M18 family aminopeptidase 2 [wastewater metagenome]|uniref:Putative M18 family aminopeptidase 2 n=2 Tax=unclassified sequences TaxID=12908 RepID=A0A5B8RC85_9ZZZZ|nr:MULTISPECIES: M18 family aminopeptidase [Arhodomonas]MCS4505823.1 M18 family aminopeptidase [Arhodomonas aquaeolei]QEA06256.1 putative M18 family aminopeptidase 2 [uncultured organism]